MQDKKLSTTNIDQSEYKSITLKPTLFLRKFDRCEQFLKEKNYSRTILILGKTLFLIIVIDRYIVCDFFDLNKGFRLYKSNRILSVFHMFRHIFTVAVDRLY